MRKNLLNIALPVISAAAVLLTSEFVSAQPAPKASTHPTDSSTVEAGTLARVTPAEGSVNGASKRPKKIVKSDKEWRKQLSRKQFEVARQGGTERAFTGRYWKHKAEGVYQCVCCELDLFPSTTKYKSGTGWPSFYAPLKKEHISTRVDRKLFYTRTEVLCSRCDAHLGHVFNDGPRPTGLRFCLNSAALTFESEAARKRRLEKEAEAQSEAETAKSDEEVENAKDDQAVDG